MKFAFLIHPLSSELKSLMEMDNGGLLRVNWGTNVLEFCRQLHHSFDNITFSVPPSAPRVVDHFQNLVSLTGAQIDGLLYEIPMDAMEILGEPNRAMALLEQAVDMAAAWGAQIVGLGSMTGIVGGQGAHLAQRGPVKVTTGNSLTVFAALQNLFHCCAEAGVDLARQTVAVIGIPGSIASAVATILAPHCLELLLVARQTSTRATRLAGELGAELLVDVPSALSRARVVLSATSSGNCIDQKLLQPGTMVIDIAVPTDVQGRQALREDTLILSGGLARVPPSFSRDSMFLGFYQGLVPSCLGETMVLALEKRAECFSIGRSLQVDRILEIGALAKHHGFDFTAMMSFGLPLEAKTIAQFVKANQRRNHFLACSNGAAADSAKAPVSTSTLHQEDGNGRFGLAEPVKKLAEQAERWHAHYLNPVLHGLGGPSGLIKTFVRGEGIHLWDNEDKRYLDMVAGGGAVNLGHNPLAVVRAVRAALEQQVPGFTRNAVNPLAAALAEKLVACTPGGLDMVHLTSSGTEAVEAALKLARIASGRPGFLYCEESCHGQSLAVLSVSGTPMAHRQLAPLLPECQAVPYGDLECLDRALHSRRFAAFIVEPIQAENGMTVAPPGYLRAAQDMCRKTRTLLIVDEVQTGLGRTGAWFAVNHDEVTPDIMVLAKSLSGGLVPIGAMLSPRDLWLKAYGTLQTCTMPTSTFGGGSLACAAARAALTVLEQDNLIDNARRQGQKFLAGLTAMSTRWPIVKAVRGRGLMLGLEFHSLPASILAHFKGMAASGIFPYLCPDLNDWIQSTVGIYFMQTLLHAHGIYTQVSQGNPRVLRIQPPLTITSDQVDTVLHALEQTCQELALAIHLSDSIINKSIGDHQFRDTEPTPLKPLSI